MNRKLKSTERIRWIEEENQFLLEQIREHSKETNMDLSRKILSHPLVAGRFLDAVQQRKRIIH